MQLLHLIQNCERLFLIMTLLMQIPFTVLTFVDKTYILSASDNSTISSIQTLALRHYIKTFEVWSTSCTGQLVTIGTTNYCETRYPTNFSKIVGKSSDCKDDWPFMQTEFSTPGWFYCFNQEYITVTCGSAGLPCYNYSEQAFPLQNIKSQTEFELNRFIGNNTQSINCDNLQHLKSLMILPIYNYYDSLNKGLHISWFINLAFVSIMLAALAIGYIFKVPGSQIIVDKVLLVTTMISMLILSIMGLILSIQRFEIGLVSDNIRAYNGCFAPGAEKNYIAGFPYLYGKLMDGYALFVLVIALILFVCVIFDLVMQLFKKSYIQGSQISSHDQYTELQELPSRKKNKKNSELQ